MRYRESHPESRMANVFGRKRTTKSSSRGNSVTSSEPRFLSSNKKQLSPTVEEVHHKADVLEVQ